ncbi:MAG TPA: HAD hydrolase-like protein [Candidatus Olsenella stercoravium]|uniref:HAD hydrolase-like protein n=1 Tax=Candidatus Olsenella stercoravium TaxID=2838713 RepID=A0A9D2DKB5_9ACTN|nr:HAD hydrolase-like protein [Candidatus Olsenella stercoravium]
MTAEDLAGRRLVIFDFDGTLANTVPVIVRTARTVLARHGLTDDDMGDLTRLVGPPFPQAYSLVYGFSEDEAAQITAEYRAIYRTIGPEAWPLFDGIVDLLSRLRAAGRLTAVASSKQMPMVRTALADNRIADLFDLALGKSSDAEGDKVALIARTLRELGVSADGAVMVGDRHHDVEAAAACGVPCVGVTYGGTGTVEELMGAGACACADTVEELGRVLLG